MFSGVCHVSLFYSVIKILSDIEEVKEEIAEYNINNATM